MWDNAPIIDSYMFGEEEIEALTQQVGEIGMIVIDTFQRNFVGNENSAEDVGNFINKLDGLISHYKCCVCLVHHTGHGNSDRGRGSSVMGASLDYEFKVQRTDKNEQMFVSFQQTLNKDGQGMAEKNFVFKEVDLIGEGLELTSGFLELTDIDFKTKEGREFSIGNEIIFINPGLSTSTNNISGYYTFYSFGNNKIVQS